MHFLLDKSFDDPWWLDQYMSFSYDENKIVGIMEGGRGCLIWETEKSIARYLLWIYKVYAEGNLRSRLSF
jgi:hypothetical protein